MEGNWSCRILWTTAGALGTAGFEQRHFMTQVPVSKALCGCYIENRMWWTDREAQTLDGAIAVILRRGDASLDPAVAVK